MKNRISQREMVFYKLYRAYKTDPAKYIAAWEFVGEMHIPEFHRHVLMSYKTPTNGLTIYHTNPGLIERKMVRGPSGSSYYAYRFAPGVKAENITEQDLRFFYNKVKSL